MNKFQWNCNHNLNFFIQENSFENVCKIVAILSRGDELIQVTACYWAAAD